MPKGVLWRQEDIFSRRALPAREVRPDRRGDRASRARIRRDPLAATPPFMHGAAHWAWRSTCGTSAAPSSSSPMVDAARSQTTSGPPSSARRPTHSAHRGGRLRAPASRPAAQEATTTSRLSVLVTSGGAILTAALKDEFLELLPQHPHQWTRSAPRRAVSRHRRYLRRSGSGRPAPATSLMAPKAIIVLLREDLSGSARAGLDEDRAGWRATGPNIPLGYYKDEEKTKRTFPVVDGVRYSVPGDRAMVEARRRTASSRTRLDDHQYWRREGLRRRGGARTEAPRGSVYDAVVVGTPHARWGQQVTAIVRLRESRQGTSEDELRAKPREAHIARYKAAARLRLRRSRSFARRAARRTTGGRSRRRRRSSAFARAAAGGARGSTARPRPALRAGTGGPSARAEHFTRAALDLAAVPAGRGPATCLQGLLTRRLRRVKARMRLAFDAEVPASVPRASSGRRSRRPALHGAHPHRDVVDEPEDPRKPPAPPEVPARGIDGDDLPGPATWPSQARAFSRASSGSAARARESARGPG